VLPELDVVRRGPAPLVLVGRNVGAEGLKVAQALACHHYVGALALNQLMKEKYIKIVVNLSRTGYDQDNIHIYMSITLQHLYVLPGYSTI
jgi:hypothetical protein